MLAITFVKAKEMSRLAMIFFALRDSYASCGAKSGILDWVMLDGSSYQQEGKDDTPKEDPLSDIELNEDATLDGGTLFENFV